MPLAREPRGALRSPLGSDDGTRFLRGTLIHRLLQTLPNMEEPAREAAARRFLARPTHGLAPDQQDEIARETLAVLADPRFAPFFGPDSRAEVPVVGLVGRDRVIAGQVDRLVVAGDAVWILDYKTNRPAPLVEDEVSPAYLQQMAAYRTALRRIYPGRAVRCVLLWTDGPRPMPLSDAILDRWAP